jgi:DNA-binding transcriptional MocR family regulator
MINPQPGGSLFEQLATRLRDQIHSGTLRPGQVVPSERTLAQQYSLGRQTVSRAVKLLRAEGLLEYRRGQGVFVREPVELTPVTPPPGSSGVVRMPTAAERAQYGLQDGVAVAVISKPNGDQVVYPGDRWALSWPYSVEV